MTAMSWSAHHSWLAGTVSYNPASNNPLLFPFRSLSNHHSSIRFGIFFTCGISATGLSSRWTSFLISFLACL